MAKYSLNNNETINCKILNENVETNEYTVKFQDGKIRNVKRYRVSHLSKLDEGVIDRVKALSGKIKEKTEAILKKIGDFIYAVVNGIKSNTLFNVMFTAKKRPGISFYPGDTFAEVCRDNGVEAEIVVDDSAETNEREEINAFLGKVIKEFKRTGKVEECYKTKWSKFYSRLNEASQDDMAADYLNPMEDAGFTTASATEIQSTIINLYNENLMHPENSKKIPVPLIWGIPGIGKTSIVNSTIDAINKLTAEKNEFNKELGTGEKPLASANIIVVNGATIQPSDISIPVIDRDEDSNKITYTDSKTNTEKTIKRANVNYVGSDFLPTYKKDRSLTDEEIAVLDNYANGGDDTHEGAGGIIFIDEYSRISMLVKQAFVSLLQSREHNGNVIGSKWIIVAAANAKVDMESATNASYSLGRAESQRFMHYRYIPTYAEWRVWATQKNSKGEQNVEQLYIDFIDANPECWINLTLSKTTVGEERSRIQAKTKAKNLGYEEEQIELNPRTYGMASAYVRMLRNSLSGSRVGDITDIGEFRAKMKEQKEDLIKQGYSEEEAEKLTQMQDSDKNAIILNRQLEKDPDNLTLLQLKQSAGLSDKQFERKIGTYAAMALDLVGPRGLRNKFENWYKASRGLNADAAAHIWLKDKEFWKSKSFDYMTFGDINDWRHENLSEVFQSIFNSLDVVSSVSKYGKILKKGRYFIAKGGTAETDEVDSDGKKKEIVIDEDTPCVYVPPVMFGDPTKQKERERNTLIYNKAADKQLNVSASCYHEYNMGERNVLMPGDSDTVMFAEGFKNVCEFLCNTVEKACDHTGFTVQNHMESIITALCGAIKVLFAVDARRDAYSISDTEVNNINNNYPLASALDFFRGAKEVEISMFMPGIKLLNKMLSDIKNKYTI